MITNALDDERTALEMSKNLDPLFAHIEAILTVLYIYIYILVAISRARYTVSSDVTWRVTQKTGCQWLEISIQRADIL